MKPLERNGPQFYYLVGYKQLHETDYKEETITNGDIGELVVEGQPIFKPYNIYIQSGNKVGKSYNKKQLIAFSGEDGMIFGCK